MLSALQSAHSLIAIQHPTKRKPYQHHVLCGNDCYDLSLCCWLPAPPGPLVHLQLNSLHARCIPVMPNITFDCLILLAWLPIVQQDGLVEASRNYSASMLIIQCSSAKRDLKDQIVLSQTETLSLMISSWLIFRTWESWSIIASFATLSHFYTLEEVLCMHAMIVMMKSKHQ